MPSQNYIGRFAPSPTGPMHFGTLIAAVASYLQAKVNQGQWLVRMEDVDTLRNVKGADAQLLRSLEAFGFEWDNNVLYQTSCNDSYQQALEQLKQQDLLFPCTCSRKLLAANDAFKENGIYPGTCRSQSLPSTDEHAIRIRIDNTTIQFDDKIQGRQSDNLSTQCGDFIIKRRDGLFAYQLAVVVDDFNQNITEVVRGVDLLDSTARQIYLQQKLAYTTPAYLHLPLALDKNGDKLSKNSGAAAVNNSNPLPELIKALRFLGQNPPDDLNHENLTTFWQWAIDHWSIDTISKQNITL